jgi:hypothetical protein
VARVSPGWQQPSIWLSIWRNLKHPEDPFEACCIGEITATLHQEDYEEEKLEVHEIDSNFYCAQDGIASVTLEM